MKLGLVVGVFVMACGCSDAAAMGPQNGQGSDRSDGGSTGSADANPTPAGSADGMVLIFY